MAAQVGLTGGIGSGKSTVAGLFNDCGIMVIDADAIAREMTAPGTQGLERIRNHFGDDVIAADQSLNRKALGEIVFSNPPEKIWLEQLLHPMIKNTSDQRARNCADQFCIMEIPLLIETGRYQDMNPVIVVHCRAEIRIERLRQSRNISQRSIRNIMASQASDEQRLKFADYVIDNSDDLSSLPTKVDSVLGSLNQRFSRETAELP